MATKKQAGDAAAPAMAAKRIGAGWACGRSMSKPLKVAWSSQSSGEFLAEDPRKNTMIAMHITLVRVYHSSRPRRLDALHFRSAA